LGIPQLEGLVRGFNLPYFKIESHSVMIDKINECLNLDGPGIIELIVDPDQSTEPRVYTEISNDGQFKTSNMERLSPVLDEKELLKALKIN
jgi:thiamine pyrophosphate-dependent acetolactate synthase large subunit-like protein